ncbi:adenine phosphoribosyltransferase [Vulgatibacter sp.]|uniref:adenine phosphoribosyltransferase n=1 Tax=Vulgatibacter sp. TaxID=1971226 RepID=UPI00356A021F
MDRIIRELIRDVPDFPQKGIVFKDVTPVLGDRVAFRRTLDLLAENYVGKHIDKVVAIEARGFIFGSALAYALGAGFAIVRKPGKLPWHVDEERYGLEYGTDVLQIHVDAVQPGERVLVLDDILATGGTARAAKRLVERRGAEVVGFGFVAELGFLHGRKLLEHDEIFSIVTY